MMIDLSGEIICEQRLEKMVDFLFEISDRVDLVSAGYHEMTKEEYEIAQTEGECLRLEMDRANGLTDEEINEMNKEWMEDEAGFEDMTDEEIQEEIELRQKVRNALENEIRIREASFLKSKEEINAVVEEKFEGLTCIDRNVTCQTHCTIGGPTVVYSLLVNEELKKHFLKMELLTWPLKTMNGGVLADDPAFYRQGKIVCSICSHEGYITLYLNEEQAKQFRSLGVPYHHREDCKEKEKPDFPYMKDTVRVFLMNSGVTTLLGQGLFDFEEDTIEDYLEFYQWFDEHQDSIRKQTKPCKKTVKEIVAYLQQKYSLEPYHSRAIDLQCQRHGWDEFFSRPLGGDSQQNKPTLHTFLYLFHYQGEELIVGGEYSSDYIFVDTSDVETKLKNLVENLDENAFGFTESNRLTEPLFQLMREINIYRGIDVYEMYDSCYFRAYIQTLRYEDIRNHTL